MLFSLLINRLLGYLEMDGPLEWDALNHLHSRGIFFLTQIYNQEASDSRMDPWIIAKDLSIQGMIKEVWDAFIHKLYAGYLSF